MTTGFILNAHEYLEHSILSRGSKTRRCTLQSGYTLVKCLHDGRYTSCIVRRTHTFQCGDQELWNCKSQLGIQIHVVIPGKPICRVQQAVWQTHCRQ